MVTTAIAENVREALRVLWAQKLRTGLTLLGITIGVGTVVGMVSIISGLNRSMARQIASLGTGVLYVSKREAGIQIGPSRLERRPDLTWEEARALTRQAAFVELVSPQVEHYDQVEFRGTRTRTVTVLGATEDFLGANDYDVARGRFLTGPEVRGRDRVAVLGKGVRESLFPGGGGLGEWVRIGKRSYRVIGFLEEKGSFLGTSQDDLVVVPLPFLVSKTRYGSSVDYIVVRPRSPEVADAARDEVIGILRRIRGLAPSEEDNFGVTSQQRLLDLYHQITRLIYVVMVVISSIGLLVGGIGVMNMMLVAVGERTREIGLRRALGAKGQDIMGQFLTESSTITLVGGIAGTLLGVLLAAVTGVAAGLPFAVPPGIVIAALSVSTGVGVVFGMYPAFRAGRLDPIEALRYE